jgi:arginyl-tRNA synthetase
MNSIEQLQGAFSHYLMQTFSIDAKTAQQCALILNTDELKQQFGDLNTNVAMVLAKQLGKPPRAIAQTIVETFKHPSIANIEIAGPGFLNLFLCQEALINLSHELIEHPTSFFIPSPDDQKRSVLIEFVSANPTGPLHFGHGRGGIIGDVLASVLSFLGNKVVKEFYINDAGAQIQKLGNSLFIRCQQAAGIEAQLPEEAYHGSYLQDIAADLIKTDGQQILNKPLRFFEQYSKEMLLARLKNTLSVYGIDFDVWFSEKTLHESGEIEDALLILQEKGHLYEQEGALWFRSTDFGDDKDRVVKKADGTYTYVAADIAYMRNKIKRGFNELVMTLGHDHHSYVVRLKALLQALGLAQNNTLEVILYQLVKIKESGLMVRMSKRAGNMITLDDVIQEVGTDVARFFYLNRKADAQLEFDLELATKKSDDNPVYYIQYAYVRTKSILDKAQEAGFKISPDLTMSAVGSDEALLIKKIASLKAILHDIGKHFQTHILAYYTVELAQLFSKYYAKHRIVDTESSQTSNDRLALVTMVRNTLELCFNLMRISKPERM